MALGSRFTRNWGREAQGAMLEMVMRDRQVAYRVRGSMLYLAGSNEEITLPFSSVAMLENVQRGRWEARHPFDGRLLATGISRRDVIRATIQKVWQ